MTVCGQIKQALQLCVIEGMEGRAKNSGGDEDGAFHTPPVFSGSGERGGLAWRCVRVCDAGRCVSAGGAGADTGETRDLISQTHSTVAASRGSFLSPYFSLTGCDHRTHSWLLLTRRALGTVPETLALSRKVRLSEDNASGGPCRCSVDNAGTG